MISSEKLEFYTNFLKNVVPEALEKLTIDTKAEWGKMKPQDMVEHLEVALLSSAIVKNSAPAPPNSAQAPFKETLIYTDTEMARNVQNPLLQYGLPPHKYSDLETAKAKLVEKMGLFFRSFENKENAISLNIFLGDLNFDEWKVFHYKHFKHHFTQFGLL